MNGIHINPSRCGAMFLGTIVLLLNEGEVVGENLHVRNEAPVPLVIQAAGVDKGMLRRARPVLLNPKEISPAIVISGNKVLTIYDAKAPNRVLYQGVIAGSARDQSIA